jgi:hypothetical protein
MSPMSIPEERWQANKLPIEPMINNSRMHLARMPKIVAQMGRMRV